MGYTAGIVSDVYPEWEVRFQLSTFQLWKFKTKYMRIDLPPSPIVLLRLSYSGLSAQVGPVQTVNRNRFQHLPETNTTLPPPSVMSPLSRVGERIIISRFDHFRAVLSSPPIGPEEKMDSGSDMVLQKIPCALLRMGRQCILSHYALYWLSGSVSPC
jgi:hypothetical protein